jgi:hypothetical protein
MKSAPGFFGINRRILLSTLAVLPALPVLRTTVAQAQQLPESPLSSWNNGPAKQAIFDFVRATTDPASPNLVPLEERIATFDQDGTLWIEHPIYSQLVYCFDRVPAVVKAKSGLANVEPFKTVLSGDREAIGQLALRDLEEIAAATLSGMTVDEFDTEVNVACRCQRPALEPALYRPHVPMKEVMSYLRAKRL